MRISRKRLMMIIALVFTLCAVTEVYGRGGGGGGRNGMGSGGGYGSPTASINARLHMDENPPFLERLRSEGGSTKIQFQRRGDFWVIENVPKGTKFIVPKGYKIRCVSFHTMANGGTSKPSENDSVIYSGGTTVMYTRSSYLYVYKD